MHLIEENMAKQLEWCSEAPPARDSSEFYTLGPWGNGSQRPSRFQARYPTGRGPLTTDPAIAGRPATTTLPAASARR
jgi:hypothetical protein